MATNPKKKKMIELLIKAKRIFGTMPAEFSDFNYSPTEAIDEFLEEFITSICEAACLPRELLFAPID